MPTSPEYAKLEKFEALTQYGTLFRYLLDEEENITPQPPSLDELQGYLSALHQYRAFLDQKN